MKHAVHVLNIKDSQVILLFCFDFVKYIENFLVFRNFLWSSRGLSFCSLHFCPLLVQLLSASIYPHITSVNILGFGVMGKSVQRKIATCLKVHSAGKSTMNPPETTKM